MQWMRLKGCWNVGSVTPYKGDRLSVSCARAVPGAHGGALPPQRMCWCIVQVHNYLIVLCTNTFDAYIRTEALLASWLVYFRQVRDLFASWKPLVIGESRLSIAELVAVERLKARLGIHRAKLFSQGLLYRAQRLNELAGNSCLSFLICHLNHLLRFTLTRLQ